MPSSVSIPSCKGCRHDHYHFSLQRLWRRVPRPLPQPASCTPQNQAGYPRMSPRCLRLQPLYLPKLWTTPPSLACLRPSPLSPVSAPEGAAVAPPPTPPTAPRTVLPHHLSPPRTPAPLLPLSSPAGLPGHVQGVVGSPQTPRPRCPLPRHCSPRFYGYPAYLGPTAPVSSPHPLHGPRRRTLQGSC